MIRKANIGFALLAIVLTILAPEGWNAVFVYSIIGLWLLQNILYGIEVGRKEGMGFWFFYAIAFFFVNLAYPIFYYRLEPSHSIFEIPWNTAVISRATAIAYLGYTWYMLGITPRPETNDAEGPKVTATRWELNPSGYAWLIGALALLFVAYIASGGWSALASVYHGNGSLRSVGLYSYIYVLLSLHSYLGCMFLPQLEGRYRLPAILVLAIILTAILLTGSRSMVLGCVLILLVGWHREVRRFRIWETVLLTLVGVMVLSSMALLRHNNQNADRMDDLVVNGRNLYVLVDYGLHHGYTGLQGMLIDIASPIPGLGRKITEWADRPYEQLSAQELPTYLVAGTGARWGLGTNMIGDAFRSFGYIGTALLMFLIGRAVRQSYRASSHSIGAYTIYYLLVGYALFYTRAPILFPPRVLIWSLILVLVWRLKRKEEPCT